MGVPAFTDPGGRLSQVEAELGQAAGEINADRRDGALTPSEAAFAHREDGVVRTEAANIARENGGEIPAISYAMLQHRVSDLDRTIYRYETEAVRG
jgi:hypothetical protein